jgi:hypothetical protein
MRYWLADAILAVARRAGAIDTTRHWDKWQVSGHSELRRLQSIEDGDQ